MKAQYTLKKGQGPKLTAQKKEVGKNLPEFGAIKPKEE